MCGIYICVRTPRVRRWPQRAERASDPLELVGVAGGWLWAASCGCWKPNSDPLGEQQGLLTYWPNFKNNSFLKQICVAFHYRPAVWNMTLCGWFLKVTQLCRTVEVGIIIYSVTIWKVRLSFPQTGPGAAAPLLPILSFSSSPEVCAASSHIQVDLFQN